MKLDRLPLVCVFLSLFAFFIFRSTITLDPDFGWHLQFGKLLLRTATVPVNDPYSYTMPSYHFVNHEWGTDVIIAVIYDNFGMLPLQVGFSLLVLGALYFLARSTRMRWVTMPLFLVGGTLFEFMGVRPQIITWFFLALIMSLWWQEKVWFRLRFIIPLLFLIWANMHGGFAIGIVVLSIFIIGTMLETRHFDKKNALVLFISFFATLCNPYGYHLWTEVTKSATDPALRWVIQEWYPAFLFTNLAFWVYTLLSVFLLIRYHRKFTITSIIVYVFLLISGLASMRNIPIFVIVSFYPTVQAIVYLYEEATVLPLGRKRFDTAAIGFSMMSLFLFIPQVGAYVYGTAILHEAQGGYPTAAVAYLRKHLPKGQVFASYDWGGYLIWQLPEKKVFIDGRMPSWRNASAPKNESTYALGDYLSIIRKDVPFAKESKKYGIDTVLVSTTELKQEPMKIFGINMDNIPFLKKFINNTTFSLAAVVSEIKQMGWKEVYNDKTAVVFEKR